MQNPTHSDGSGSLLPQVDMLVAALAYARKGWRVLPLHSVTIAGFCTCKHVDCTYAGQHPRIPYTVKDATTNFQTITQWWQDYPDANIGIATGEGLLVLNVDPTQGGSIEKLKEFFAIPETTLARSGDGNWQLYFSYNRALHLCNTKNKIGVGIESKADGSYVIAPPSLCRAHVRAVFLNELEPVNIPPLLLPPILQTQALPSLLSVDFSMVPPEQHALVQAELQFLATLLAPESPATSEWYATSHQKALPARFILAEKKRDIVLQQSAAMLKRVGACDDVLLTALQAFNRVQCRPPLSQEAVRTIVKRTGHGSPVLPVDKRDSVDAATIFPLEQLMTMPIVEPAWIIPGILPQGITLFAGRPMLGKTQLILEWSLALAGGVSVLDKFPVEPGGVLFFGLEDSIQSMYARAHSILHDRAIPSDFAWTSNWSRLNAGGLADLEEWLDIHPETRLVVVDALVRVHTFTRASPTLRDYTILTPLRRIAEQYHVSVLVLHHLRKSRPADLADEIQTLADLQDIVNCTMVLQHDHTQERTTLHISGTGMAAQTLLLRYHRTTSHWELECDDRPA